MFFVLKLQQEQRNLLTHFDVFNRMTKCEETYFFVYFNNEESANKFKQNCNINKQLTVTHFKITLSSLPKLQNISCLNGIYYNVMFYLL